MKKLAVTAVALLFAGSSFAQSQKADDPNLATSSTATPPAGYMGLWDLYAGTGYMNRGSHQDYVPTGYEDKKMSGGFLMISMQESMLSNYIWADQTDKKFKFGFTESLDLGCSYTTRTTTSSYPANDSKETKPGFLFTYQAGLAGVLRINQRIDAGFTYYPFVISSFTPSRHFAKFRFRYSHLMCEVSALGKTALDLKYLRSDRKKAGERYDRSSNYYIGFSYVNHREDPHEDNTPTFAYLTLGYTF